MVVTQCTSQVPALPAQPDQKAVALFPEPVPFDQPLCAPDRLRPPLPPLVPVSELLQRLQVQGGQPRSFPGRPLVIAALQQVPAVEVHCFFEPPVGHGPLELLRVQPERRVLTPPQRPGTHVDQTVGPGEFAAQDQQYLAQIGACLGLLRLRPQEERELPTGQRGMTVQQQAGE